MRVPFVLTASTLDGLDAGDVVALHHERVGHLRRVLRLDDGADVQVTDGSGRRAAATLLGEAVRLTAMPDVEPPSRPRIVVHHAVPKGRGLDEVVRTLAELGVAAVRPVLTDHTEARPTGDRAHDVGDRLRAIAVSALQQAHSAHLCRVADPSALDVTLRGQSGDHIGLAADPQASMTLGERMATVGTAATIHVLIGPEGGISDRELGLLRDAGWSGVRAGTTVLRSVHAATVLTAAITALAGGYGPRDVSSG